MRRTLYSRVFGYYVLIVVVGLAVLGVVGGTGLAHDLRRRSLIELEELASFAASIVPLTATESPQLAPETAAADYTVTLLSSDGEPVAGDRAAPPLPLSLPLLRRADLPVSGLTDDAGERDGFAWAIAGVDQPGGARSYVYVTKRLALIDEQTRGTLFLILLTAGLFTFALAMLIYRVLRWINEPIYAIQGAARRYAQGELEVHLRTNGPPELQRLGDDLNAMAEELRNRIQAISDQRNQLEAILSSMLEGVVVLDEGRGIVGMNEAAGQLLRVAPGDARGRTLIEYLRNAQLDELAELALDGDQPIERTITLYRDRPIHLQVHATPLRAEGATRPTGSLLVMNDITRLKHLEGLRKDFVANVSHELKTPLTSIKGFVETLLDGAASDPDNAQRFLRIILMHTNRVHMIIEDLLSLSRLEQSDQRITFYRFATEKLMSTSLEFCGPRAEAKRIALVPTVSGEPTAWGNPNLLEQALVNLVDNAIKYSPESSRVEIEIRNDHDSLRIRVMDHGQGIRNQDLPRIFERFYRTDKARSRELGGTGLGLAIVKHIARAHRGEVSVQSILGEGSTFTMEIPQHDAERFSDGRLPDEWDELS